MITDFYSLLKRLLSLPNDSQLVKQWLINISWGFIGQMYQKPGVRVCDATFAGYESCIISSPVDSIVL